jgi:collagen type III alpha
MRPNLESGAEQPPAAVSNRDAFMALAEPKQPQSKTSGPSGSSRFVDFDEFIDLKLRKARTGIHHTDLLAGAVVLTAAVLGYLLVFTLFDHWIVPGGFGLTARLVMLAVVLAFAFGWIGWKIVWPYMRQVNALYAARQIEQTYPDLKSSLLSWVDLRNSGRPVSPAILKAIEKRTAVQMSHADVDRAVDRQFLMRAAYTLLAIVALTSVYVIASPKKMSTSVWRALFPTSQVAAATRTEILEVKPGETEVLARDQVDVTVELKGVVPERVMLYFTTADRRFVDEPIEMRNTGEGLPRFRARLAGEDGSGLIRDVRYRIVAGDAQSPTYLIRVNQPPSATVREVVYTYPDYMKLDETTQEGSTIDAWEGTRVTLRAEPNMPVKRAVLFFTDTERVEETAESIPMTVQDGRLEANWRLKFRNDGTFARYYHVQVWNERDQKDPQPTLHRIKVRPDLPPEITLTHPTSDLEAPANGVVPIAFGVKDPDFMLRRVTLKLERQGETLPVSPRLLEAPPERERFSTVHRLKLEPFRMEPGEQLTFYVEAEDNLEPFENRGKNISRSSRITITISEPKSEEEVERFEQEQQEQLDEKLEQADPRTREPSAEPMPDPERDPAQEDDMPDDPAQDDRQPAEETPADPSQPPGETDESMPGDAGTEPQPDQTQQQPSESKEGTPDSEPADGGREPSPGELADGSEGEGEPQEPGTGQPPPRREKAPEDEALRELLDWSRQRQDQQEQQPGQQPEQPDEPDPRSRPDESAPEERPQEGMPGDESKPEMTEPDGTQPDSSRPDGTDEPGMDPSQPQSPSTPPTPPSDPSQPQQPGAGDDDDMPSRPDEAPGTGGEPGTGSKSDEGMDESPDKSPGSPTGEPSQPDAADAPQPSEKPTGDAPAEQTPDPSEPQEPGESGISKTDDPAPKGDRPPQEAPGKESPDKPDGTEPAEPAPGERPDSKSGEPAPTESDAPDSPRDPSTPREGTDAPKSESRTTDQKPDGMSEPSPSSPGERSPESPPSPGEEKPDAPGQPGDPMSPTGEKSPGSPSDPQPSETPAGERPAGEAPGEPAPPDSSPAGSTPEGTPDAPSGETPSGETPAADAPPGETPPGEGQMTDAPAGEPQPGDSQPGDATPGDSPPSDGQPDGAGDGQQGEGAGDGPADGAPGEAMGEGPVGTPSGATTGGGGTEGGRSPADGAPGEGDASAAPPAEEADLSNRKKATNLALQQLREQLERGETPQELMDELGYTQQDLENFMRRLEERLADPGTDRSPEAESARRQFESLLQGIDYESRGEFRGGGDRQREASESFGTSRRPVPPEYRLDDEAYKRRTSRQGTQR